MKIRTTLTIAAAVLMLTSCSVDAIIDQMDKAAQKGDLEKVEKLGIKLDKKTNHGADLTASQAARVVAISGKAAAKAAGNFLFGDDE